MLGVNATYKETLSDQGTSFCLSVQSWKPYWLWGVITKKPTCLLAGLLDSSKTQVETGLEPPTLWRSPGTWCSTHDKLVFCALFLSGNLDARVCDINAANLRHHISFPKVFIPFLFDPKSKEGWIISMTFWVVWLITVMTIKWAPGMIMKASVNKVN